MQKRSSVTSIGLRWAATLEAGKPCISCAQPTLVFRTEFRRGRSSLRRTIQLSRCACTLHKSTDGDGLARSSAGFGLQNTTADDLRLRGRLYRYS